MRILMSGVNGSDVRVWQEFLVNRNYDPGSVDGIFGNRTSAATVQFQTAQGLSPDGVVGGNTLARAQALGFVPLPLFFTRPVAGASFPLNEAVEFSGMADADIDHVELTTDDAFSLPTVTLNNGIWQIANRFRTSGRRTIVARGFKGDKEAANDSVMLFIAAEDFRTLVPIPSEINKDLKMVSQQTMLGTFGKPCNLSPECSPVTNGKIRALIVTDNVGPFVVTGLRPAVEALKRICARVQQEAPDLYSQISTAGMLCCRRVRALAGQPPSPNYSNHSWGTAIDIKITGTLDPRGDGRTLLGLLALSPFFHEEKFFWGAGFGGASEDSMHFEASDNLIREWQVQGLLNS